MVNEIQSKLEINMKISMQNFKQVQQFIQNEVAQVHFYFIQQYKKRKNPTQITLKKKQAKLVQKSATELQNIYPQLQQLFLQVDLKQQQKYSKVKQSCEFLETNVLNNQLDFQIKNFKQFLQELRSSMAYREKLCQTTDQKVLKALQQLEGFIPAKSDKSIFDFEHKLKENFKVQLMQVFKYGEEILHFWKETLLREQQRFQILQNVLQIQSKNEEKKCNLNNDVQQAYSISRLLTNEAIECIKKAFKKETIVFEDIENYLMKFPQDLPSIYPLQLRQFKALRDIGGITTKFAPVKLVFTVDHFVVLVDENVANSPKQRQKIVYQMKVSGISFKNKKSKVKQYLCLIVCLQNNFLMFMIEKTPGLVFNSTKKYLLKFEKEDDFQELKMYLDMRQKIK